MMDLFVSDNVLSVLRDKTNDVAARKEEACKKRRKKRATTSLVSSCFQGKEFRQFLCFKILISL